MTYHCASRRADNTVAYLFPISLFPHTNLFLLLQPFLQTMATTTMTTTTAMMTTTTTTTTMMTTMMATRQHQAAPTMAAAQTTGAGATIRASSRTATSGRRMP